MSSLKAAYSLRVTGLNKLMQNGIYQELSWKQTLKF